MFKEYLIGDGIDDIEKVIGQLSADFEKAELKSDPMIRFKYELVPELVEGRHTWTMRYKPNGVRYPFSKNVFRNLLPVCIDPEENGTWVPIGHVAIPRMAVGHVRDWPARHKAIKGSGWRSKAAMVDGMTDIYEPIYHREITDDDIMFAYKLDGFYLDAEFAKHYHKIFG